MQPYLLGLIGCWEWVVLAGLLTALYAAQVGWAHQLLKGLPVWIGEWVVLVRVCSRAFWLPGAPSPLTQRLPTGVVSLSLSLSG